MKLAFSQPALREDQSFVIDIPDDPRIEPEILIGRASNCDIQIPHGSVSRRHCGIRVDPTNRSLHVYDLGSRSGTFINGRCVTGRREIVAGDTLTVGSLALTVNVVDANVWERIAARARAAQVGAPRAMQFVGA